MLENTIFNVDLETNLVSFRLSCIKYLKYIFPVGQIFPPIWNSLNYSHGQSATPENENGVL